MKLDATKNKSCLALSISLLLFALFCLPAFVNASSTQGTLTDDSYVREDTPGTNYGTDNQLQLKSADGKDRYTYVKFTVSSISGSVDTALLKMYSVDIGQNATVKTVSDTSWTEGSITWNNHPTMGNTLDSQYVGNNQWVEFDVTTHITGNGTFSIGIEGDLNANGKNFYSSDFSNGDYAPELNITYTAGNNPPSFNSDPFSKSDATEGTAYSGSISGDASDPDSDPLTFSKVTGPTWLNVAANGALSGTPGSTDVGNNSWTVKVEDGNGGDDTATMNITVNAAGNQPPSFNSDPFTKQNAIVDQAYSGSIAGDASDPESDPLTFSKTGGPTWLSVASNGNLSGTPGSGDTGLNQFTVKVEDDHSGSDTATMKITVTDLTEASVIDEQFAWSATGAICTATGGVGSREVIRYSSSTGFGWGGYNAATSGSRDIQAITGSIDLDDDATDSANVVGSYVYTIFSDQGENTPTHYIDITSVGATFKLMALQAANDQAVRWLIRDANGDWYISENQTPSDAIPEKDTAIPDLGRAYVVPWYTWKHVSESNETEMNQLDNDGDMALSIDSSADPDLSMITGCGFYISRSSASKNFELDWFKVWKFEPVAPACPEYSSHEINTRVGMMVGYSQWGGGGSGEVRLNSGGNMNAAGWGKGWLSAFRSKLHSGRYNPTQGGRDESYGACTEMWYETSSTGGGLTRVEYGPFQVATMGQWDNTQYNDLTPWWSASGDDDGLAEVGYTEKDEIMSEFWMEGYYEDVSNIITNQDVASIHLYQQYDYLDAPHMILQYDAVLDWSYSITDISSYISGDQTSTHIDPSTNLWFYGFRTNRNVCSYNHVWYPTATGWEKFALNELGEWHYPTNPQYYAMLVTGTSDTDDAICLYYPSWSTFNQYNVAGVNNSTGAIVYQENRMQTTDGTHPDWRAAWRQGADSFNTWDEEYPGCEGTRNMNKIDFAIHPSGVLAPENGLEGCHEQVRYEAFFIFGEAGDIKDAIDDIDAYFGPPDTTAPAAPTGLAATAGDGQVSLDWNYNTEGDLDGYNVYRSTTTGTGYSKINGSLVSASAYTDSTVSNGTTYYYVVTAVDTSSNESGYSNEDSAAPVGDTTAPANPTGLAATGGDSQVSLDWNDNTEGDLDGYNVYRSTTTGSGYSKINGSLVSVSAYTDNTVSNGTTYYYVVTAVDASSNESGYSNEDSATPGAPEWTQLTYDDFESGWGNLTSGGVDAKLYTDGTYAHQGTACADIEDDTGVTASFYHTNGIDVDTAGYTQIKVEFWFKAISFDNSDEDFWVQYYDGTDWHTVATYAYETDFDNDIFYDKTGANAVYINEGTGEGEYTFPTDMKIRFMCDASGGGDDAYIDEIRVSAK